MIAQIKQQKKEARILNMKRLYKNIFGKYVRKNIVLIPTIVWWWICLLWSGSRTRRCGAPARTGGPGDTSASSAAVLVRQLGWRDRGGVCRSNGSWSWCGRSFLSSDCSGAGRRAVVLENVRLGRSLRAPPAWGAALPRLKNLHHFMTHVEPAKKI